MQPLECGRATLALAEFSRVGRRGRLTASTFWAYDSDKRDTRLKLQWRGGCRVSMAGFSEVGRRLDRALLATLWGQGQEPRR